MQLGYRNVKQEVERPAMVGETRVGAVIEDCVKTLLLQCIRVI